MDHNTIPNRVNSCPASFANDSYDQHYWAFGSMVVRAVVVEDLVPLLVAVAALVKGTQIF